MPITTLAGAFYLGVAALPLFCIKRDFPHGHATSATAGGALSDALDNFRVAAHAEALATGILALIGRLSPGDGLCHADLNPTNVIMTAEGPKIIDWAFSVRAPPPSTLRAVTSPISTSFAPEDVDAARPHALNAAVQSEYARLAGISPAALTAAMEPYLPILRAFAIAEPATHPAGRESLIQPSKRPCARRTEFF